MRMLMIGLDSMDQARFRGFLDTGRLPNLANFAERSSSVALTSDSEHMHGGVWPSFASGTGLGTHGIFFMIQWLAEEKRLVRNSHPAFAFHPFWEDLANAGRGVCVVDIPYVPAVTVPGSRVCAGWGLHDEMEHYSHPHSFRRELDRRFGKNPLSVDVLEPLDGAAKAKMAKRMRRGVAMRSRLVAELASGSDWDFMSVVFGEVHLAGHYLAAPEMLTNRSDNEDAMSWILEPLDRAWPDIERAAGPDCLIALFSLAGMKQHRALDGLTAQIAGLLNGDEAVDEPPDLLRRVRNALPTRVHEELWKRLPAGVRAARMNRLSLGNTNVETAAVLPLPHDGHAAFQLNPTSESATVSGPELEAQLRDLQQRILDSSGRPAFSDVIRPQELYAGVRSVRLPDAMLVSDVVSGNDDEFIVQGGPTMRLGRPSARNGAHTSAGFMLLVHPNNAPRTRDVAAVEDIAPTVLSLFDIPPRASFEGESIFG